MPACLPRRIGVTTGAALTAALFLWGAAPALAQNRVGSGGGSGGGGGFGGGSGSFSGGGGSFSGGGGFSGGSMGGSFSGGGGGSGNFTGTSYAPSQLTGTGTGGAGGQGFGGFGGGGALGGTSGGVQPGNVLGAYYANPYAAGIQNTARAATFGTPIYNTTTTVSQVTTGLGVGARGAGSSLGGSGLGVGSVGAARAPSYTAVIGFSRPVAAPTQIQADVQQVLARSSSISQNRAIRVDLVGPTVVLRGMVADDHDRALAEGLTRMTPGVRDVRNELQTLAGLPPAAPGQ